MVVQVTQTALLINAVLAAITVLVSIAGLVGEPRESDTWLGILFIISWMWFGCAIGLILSMGVEIIR